MNGRLKVVKNWKIPWRDAHLLCSWKPWYLTWGQQTFRTAGILYLCKYQPSYELTMVWSSIRPGKRYQHETIAEENVRYCRWKRKGIPTGKRAVITTVNNPEKKEVRKAELAKACIFKEIVITNAAAALLPYKPNMTVVSCWQCQTVTNGNKNKNEPEKWIYWRPLLQGCCWQFS